MKTKLTPQRAASETRHSLKQFIRKQHADLLRFISGQAKRNDKRKGGLGRTVAVAMLAAVLFTGCTTTNPPQTPAQKAARVGTVCELAAFTGSQAYVAAHPESRPYFVASRVALGELLSNTNITTADVSAAVAALPIKELSGNEGSVSMAVGSALIIYDSMLRDSVNLDVSPYLRETVSGLYRGLTRGLGL